MTGPLGRGPEIVCHFKVTGQCSQSPPPGVSEVAGSADGSSSLGDRGGGGKLELHFNAPLFGRSSKMRDVPRSFVTATESNRRLRCPIPPEVAFHAIDFLVGIGRNFSPKLRGWRSMRPEIRDASARLLSIISRLIKEVEAARQKEEKVENVIKRTPALC